jgi:gluconate kinase
MNKLECKRVVLGTIGRSHASEWILVLLSTYPAPQRKKYPGEWMETGCHRLRSYLTSFAEVGHGAASQHIFKSAQNRIWCFLPHHPADRIVSEPFTKMSESLQASIPSSYVVLLSGTHVTGKETLAVSLSKSLGCPWLKGEMSHGSALFGSRSQAKKGYDYSEVFGRIWFSKLRRMGFLVDRYEPSGERKVPAPRIVGRECTAIITCFAMRKPAREAIRETMLARSIKPIFVIMQITVETLAGRTLGAEEPELAAKIMGHKIADIQAPQDDEQDVIVIDSMRDVEALFFEIKEAIDNRITTLSNT